MNKETTVCVPCRIGSITTSNTANSKNQTKYFATLIIDKSNDELKNKIAKAIQCAEDIGRKNKWMNFKDATIVQPVIDGDVDKKDDPNYNNANYIIASTYNKPEVVDAKLNRITFNDVYPGAYCNVIVNFYPFSSDKIGIAANLGDIQFLNKGERIVKKSRIQYEFEAVSD